MREVPAGIERRIAELFPGARIVGVHELMPDRAGSTTTTKGGGYGLPWRIDIVDADGKARSLVFRTQSPNEFGHERRADRAEGLLLAYDTFGHVPRHVKAIDVGAVAADGRLLSVHEGREFYLITTFAEGQPYAEDLRRIGVAGRASALDLERCEALAKYLVWLHETRGGRPQTYIRAIRDLVGHGEGIFGIIDGFPPVVPAAPAERLRKIELACIDWRWKLRGKETRLARTHGDFHPFNVVFAEGTELTLLDASRGGAGDPADDVTCMAVNYLFFALDRPATWAEGFRPLWRRFWDVYLAESHDKDLLSVAAPFLAWRGLVLANPRFYPHLGARARDLLLRYVEGVLTAPALDPEAADALFV